MADVIYDLVARETAGGTPFTTVFLYPDGSDQESNIHVPDSIAAGAPCDLVVFCHGLNGEEDQFWSNSSARKLLEGLLDAGRYVVVESLAHGRNFGNDAALADYVAIGGYALRTYKIASTFLIGQSMGGIPSLLLYAGGDFPNIRGWVGIGALCDLTEANQARLMEAYGITDPAELPTATAGHDPMLLDVAVWDRCFRFYGSFEDTNVLWANNGLRLQTRMLTRDPDPIESDAVEVTGGHLSADHYQPDDVLAFFDRARLAEPEEPPEESELATFEFELNGEMVPVALYWGDGFRWNPVSMVRL